MGIFDYLRGWVELEIQGAFPESVLNSCAGRNMEFWSVKKIDHCTIRMKVRRKDGDTVRDLALRCQCQVTRATPRGAHTRMKALRGRYALFIGALVCAGVLAVSSSFVWEIRVEGNETLSDGQIIRALKDSGAEIGSFWPAFSGDALRNELLLAMPELRWAAVNYDCSTITVIVREKTEMPEMVYEDEAVHVVAEKAGVISHVSVLKGRPVVSAHQTVLEGEQLISGAVPSTVGDTRIVHAYGTVKARTWYEIPAVRACSQMEKDYTGATTIRFALKFGMNRVNFYGNSSIYDGNCDKIIMEYPLSVEGVFTLPVTLIRETYVEYAPTWTEASTDGMKQEMKTELLEYLDSLLEEGDSVTTATVGFSEADGVLTATLHAECLEDIGVEVPMTETEIQQIRLENSQEMNDGDD